MALESVGPYRVLEKLGAGGMGEVFLAEDTRLGRKVALKSLTEQWAKAPDARRRIFHEARAAAGLNHTNIATVYDVVETADASYIVMEYAPGESLSEMLRRGPLPPEAVVWIGAQLCDALSAAHARGIVHRDLKPANLILSPEGHLKVLDFGLAKTLELESGPREGSGDIHVSQGGRLVGTLPYVPPEHILGEAADERGDIYSAGVVLFELLAGRRPYDGTDKKALARAIVEGQVPDLVALRPEVPAGLAGLVRRAMSRNPKDRPPTAGALRAELEQLSGARSGWQTMTDLQRPFGLRSAPSPASRGQRRRKRNLMAGGAVLLAVLLGLYVARKPPLSRAPERAPVVAVLPLSNATAEAAHDAELIGFADLIVSALSGLPQVNVVSRSAVMESRERLKQPRQLAAELGADLLVDGSVQRLSNRVRVTVSLTRAATMVVSWSRVFEGAASDMFALEKSVAEEVAQAVRGGVSPEELKRIERVLPRGQEALAIYGEARALLDRSDVSGNPERAIRLFESALAKDPRFALAAAGLADAYWAKYGETKEAPDAEEARRAVDRALALDPEQPQVRLALADQLRKTGKAAEAIPELQRLLRQQPASDDAHRTLGELLLERGRVEEGLAELHRAQSLRPGFWRNHYVLGLAFLDLGRYGEATVALTRLTELQPDSSWGFLALGVAQQGAGRRPEAALNYRRSIALDPSSQAWSNLGQIAYVEGRLDDAKNAFEAALSLDPRDAPAYRNLGDLYKRQGDLDKARRRYQRAVELAEEAVRVNPGSGLDHARLGVYLAKMGRTADGLASIARAIELGPENVEILYRKAVVQALAGRRGEARETLDRALARGYSRVLASEDEDVSGLLPATPGNNPAEGAASRR